MFHPNEKKILEKFLSLTPVPDETFNYDELQGFMFGLAITPESIPQSEWLPIIFGGELPEFKDLKNIAEMIDCLVRVYNRLVAHFHDNTLHFPFDLDTLHDDQLETVYGWVSGFEEALAVREELWDPEEFPGLSERKKEDLMHAIMTIQGLVDPGEVLEFFEKLPDDAFREAFPNITEEFADREVQIQVFLLASLPLAVEIFQNHARALEKKRNRPNGGHTIPIPIRPAKTEDVNSCASCSGKKCGASGPTPKPAPKSDRQGKKSNVIKVDFPKHGKRQSDSTAPVFQLKISLQGTKPPIWRRIQVPGDTTLERLHKVIQLCMGWSDSHLHQFLIDHTCYCLPEEEDSWRTSRPKDEAKFTLQALQEKILPGFQYIYDYGDDWLHQIVVEKILAPAEGKPYPLLLTGKRACPPEDSGGIAGLMHLLEVLANPKDESYEEIKDWLDEEYDPARFGKEEIALINAVLEEMYG